MTSSRARAGPARSASRCVPPMAGVRPTTVSTSPKRADSAASSRSQASESSKAAVRHRAWAANTVGSASSSTVWIICEQLGPQLAGGLRAEAVEEVHVDAAADHAPLGAHEQAARRVGRDVGDGRLQGGDHRRVEEVQRRRVEGQDGERPVALEADRLGPVSARSAAPAAAISSASPGPGTHGRRSGSSR